MQAVAAVERERLLYEVQLIPLEKQDSYWSEQDLMQQYMQSAVQAMCIVTVNVCKRCRISRMLIALSGSLCCHCRDLLHSMMQGLAAYIVYM